MQFEKPFKNNNKKPFEVRKEIVKLKKGVFNKRKSKMFMTKYINQMNSKNIEPTIDKYSDYDAMVNSKILTNDIIEDDFVDKYDNNIKCTNSIIISEKVNEKETTGCTEKCMLTEGLFIENSKNDIEDLQSLLIKLAISSDDSDANLNKENIENNLTKNMIIENGNIDNNGLNFLNIVQLKSESSKKQELLIRKYVDKWKVYVEKKRNELANSRKSAINNFFDKLDKKRSINEFKKGNKFDLSARDFNKYQHRYKRQKHIIALQKVKLEEQHRLIEELKYNKIIEASKESVDAMKEEVRKTYFEIDRNLKPKIKCLTNELNLQEIEEPSLILHCLKVPQFLQRMEKRAREREEKHALIRERRRQMEEEKLKLKQQAELAKAEMDKEEKIKRIQELRERRKREKIENIRKKQHAEKMRALKVMVDLHYERNLLLRCGIRPWVKLLEIKRDNINKAKSHYKFQLKNNVFLHWMWHTEDMLFDRNYRAEEFYRMTMARKIFNVLLENFQNYILKKQTAEDYYDIILLSNVFKKFKEGVAFSKQEYENKLLKAHAYYNCNLIFKTFTLWRTLPALNALKREQEARKSKWRQKVLQVVPDYTPPDE